MSLWVISGLAVQKAMSALPPKADMCSAAAYVRFVPIADIRHSFDHLVGAAKERGRESEAERLRSLEIDDEFDLRRPLDW